MSADVERLRHLLDDPRDASNLASRCTRQWWARAFTVDIPRLHEQMLVRIAVASSAIGPPPWPDGWVEQRIDEALKDLLTEDADAGSRGETYPDPFTSPYAFMTVWLGIEPQFARKACLRFNGLPERTRKIFFAAMFDGKDAESCRSMQLGAPDTIQAELDVAYRALFLLPEHPRGDAMERRSP